MNDFNSIRSKWAGRHLPPPPINGYKEAIKTADAIKKKQCLGILILIATAGCLLAFFFQIAAYNDVALTSGLMLMIGALLLRIGVEFFSNRRLNAFTPTLEVEEFAKKIEAYYKARFLIHVFLTPILFMVYVAGFLVLLPSFKANFSAGFYRYILLSATLSFVFLIILIAIQTKKELKKLKQLKRGADPGQYH